MLIATFFKLYPDRKITECTVLEQQNHLQAGKITVIFSLLALLSLLPFSSSEGIGNLKSDKLSLVTSTELAPNYCLGTY